MTEASKVSNFTCASKSSQSPCSFLAMKASLSKCPTSLLLFPQSTSFSQAASEMTSPSTDHTNHQPNHHDDAASKHLLYSRSGLFLLFVCPFVSSVFSISVGEGKLQVTVELSTDSFIPADRPYLPSGRVVLGLHTRTYVHRYLRRYYPMHAEVRTDHFDRASARRDVTPFVDIASFLGRLLVSVSAYLRYPS